MADMDRITIKMLESRVDCLNKILNRPPTAYTRSGTKFEANIGNFHLSEAYGGVCVHEMLGKGGGITEPIFYGHRPKREAFNLLNAYIRGIEQHV